jgi:hypothetical protein
MRGARAPAVLAAAVLIAGCGVAGDSPPGSRAGESPALPPPDDVLEPGLQGQVPLSEQLMRVPGAVPGGVTPAAYRRGTRLVPPSPLGITDLQSGLARGGNYELAWLDDCAYVGVGDPLRQALSEQGVQGSEVPLPAAPGALPAAGAADETEGGGGCEAIPGLPSDPCHPPDPPADLPSAGIAIISARNPAQPDWIYTMQLRITPRSPSVGGPSPQPPSELRTSTATANPWEALKSNDARRMIVAGTANELVIYQAVYNCKYPSRRSITDTGDFMIHGLRIADDGMTAYLGDQNARAVPGAPLLAAMDLANLRSPVLLASYADPGLGAAGIHGIDVNPEGTRAYVTYGPPAHALPPGIMAPPPSGLLVLDVSEIQARRPGAQIRKLGQLEWEGAPHAVRYARIGKRPHLVVADQLPWQAACPWGWARVVDLADEAAPREVSTIALEVNDPAQCGATNQDGAVYSAASVSVDSATDTRLAFFGWGASGMRVYDLSQPAAPVEVAYYNPAPNPDTLYRSFATTGGLTLDATLSSVRAYPETGHLWFTSVASGFHILEFTRSMGPAP